MTSQNKSASRKRGTPRLPIPKRPLLTGTRKPVANVHRTGASLAVPDVGLNSSVAGSIAVAVVVRNAQAAPVEPLQPLNLSQEKLLTVKEAAYRLGKSSSIIREWLHGGRLRGWQPGGLRCSLMVSQASVEEMLTFAVPIRKRRK